MADELQPWWFESESDIAGHLRDGYTRVAKRVELTFGATFKTPPDRPTDSPAIGFRIGGIRVGSIERHVYGYVVRWQGDNIRSAYMSWIGALRGGEPPIYVDGGGVTFRDLEASKLSIASFFAYFASDGNRSTLLS